MLKLPNLDLYPCLCLGFYILFAADLADLQSGRSNPRKVPGCGKRAAEVAGVAAPHRHAVPLVRHHGGRSAAAPHPVLQAVLHDGHHRGDRPGLLLSRHCPAAAAAAHAPTICKVPRTPDLGDQRSGSAPGPGEVCPVPRPAPAAAIP